MQDPAAEPEVVIDVGPLTKLKKYGGTALVSRMIAEVLATAEQRIAAVTAGRESGDVLAVARAAHSLKGSAAIVGARTLQERASALEQRASAGDGASVAPLVAALEAAYRATRKKLLERLHELES